MIIQIAILIAGLVLVLTGAEGLVDGASGLARKWGVSEFVIGLTIVAIGTSMPEMVVSVISAIEGKPDMAVGNIIGSNIFNTALILGLSAVICPITITRSNLRRDIPINILVTALLILLSLNFTITGHGSDQLSRIDGAVFIALLVWYIYSSFKNDRENVSATGDEVDEAPVMVWKALIYVIGGLVLLVVGGRLFVDAAQKIAHMAGLSDKFIAITVLAAGTSLPELATSAVAAARGKGQLALGNILGSNTFNILLILGSSALICPLASEQISVVDFGVVMFCSVFLLFSAFFNKKQKLDRFEGVILLMIEAAYMTYLIMNI